MFIYRGLRLLGIVAAFFIRTNIVRLFKKDSTDRFRSLAALTRCYSRKVMKLFCVNISVIDAAELFNSAPCLIVSNHLSYLDVLILTSVKPTLFLSHKGIEREPIIGTLAACGGTVFVDKSAKANLMFEMMQLADILEGGNSLTLFPEGATGDGEMVRPFHSAFIEAAVRAGTSVLPVCLQYCRINGSPVTKENKNLIFIYGEMPFLPHIWALFKNLKTLDVTIKVFDRIPSIGRSRKEIAQCARDVIVGEFLTV